jgi:hypothetical protein
LILSGLVWLVGWMSGSLAPAWMRLLGFLLFEGGIGCEAFVGGLLLTCWPSVMSGTRIERGWIASAAPRWLYGLPLAWFGCCLATSAAIYWTSNAGVISMRAPSWLAVTLIVIGSLPYFMLTLAVPLVRKRRIRG